MKNYILTVLLLVVGICLIYVCFSIYQSWNKPNTRWYIKENMKGWADLNITEEERYTVITIGNKEQHFAVLSPHFVFRLNNHIIDSHAIDTKMLKENCLRYDNPNKYSAEWPEGSEQLFFAEGYHIIINKDQILEFQASLPSEATKQSGKDVVPELGPQTANELYKMPLTEEQMINIFGSPDKFTEFFVH